jgi:hypothetical protein
MPTQRPAALLACAGALPFIAAAMAIAAVACLVFLLSRLFH